MKIVISCWMIGMVLFKKGIMIGRKNTRFYRRMAGICYGIGIPLSLFGLWYYHHESSSFTNILRYGFTQTHLSGPIVALGHIALLNLAINGRFLTQV